MASFNKVILAGNLTNDPELRYTPSGVAIARIRLAVNRVRRMESGETKEEVTFVDVEAFRKQAETLGQYLKKGSPLLMEGRLKLDQWEDKQTGQKRSRLGVILENFQFLDSPSQRSGGGFSGGSNASANANENANPQQRAQPSAAPPASSSVEGDSMPDDDDVPF